MSKGNTSVGIGFNGLLTILFIGLKLANVINWSWWLVLAPSWIPMLIVVVLISVAVFLKALK